MFTMGMLGDFDRDVFGEHAFTVSFFVAFMTIVVIVMLNVSGARGDSVGVHHAPRLRRCSSPLSPIHTVSVHALNGLVGLIKHVSARTEAAMVQSRQLFLRSRFELALTMEGMLQRSRRATRFRQLAFLAMLLGCLPFGFIYVPLFLFAKLASGVWPALKDVKIEFCDWLANLLRAVAKTMDDDDDDNEVVAWEGRVLDVERRTKQALKDVERRAKGTQDALEARMGKLETKTDRVLGLLELLVKKSGNT